MNREVTIENQIIDCVQFVNKDGLLFTNGLMSDETPFWLIERFDSGFFKYAIDENNQIYIADIDNVKVVKTGDIIAIDNDDRIIVCPYNVFIRSNGTLKVTNKNAKIREYEL